VCLNDYLLHTLFLYAISVSTIQMLFPIVYILFTQTNYNPKY